MQKTLYKRLIFFLFLFALVDNSCGIQFSSKFRKEIDKILHEEFFENEIQVAEEEEREELPKDGIVVLSKGKKNNQLEIQNEIKTGNRLKYK